jgi:hypothetical protein
MGQTANISVIAYMARGPVKQAQQNETLAVLIKSTIMHFIVDNNFLPFLTDILTHYLQLASQRLLQKNKPTEMPI